MKIFGERLRQLRTALGETQQEFANRLCLSKQIISNYENDMRSPDIETLLDIANKLDVSTDYLLGKIERKRLENIDIGERTGLSDEAIDRLKAWPGDFDFVFSTLVAHYSFPYLLSRIYDYAECDFDDVNNSIRKKLSAYSDLAKDNPERYLLNAIMLVTEDIIKDIRKAFITQVKMEG